MARPVLRDLGMFAWTKAMAAAGSLTARYSTPGQHAQLVSQRLGSRTALVELVSGPLRPLLKCYVDAPNRSDPKRKDSSDDPIVYLGGLAYLTFNRMAHAIPSTERSTIRESIDDLCGRRLARRGLVLGCTDCGRPSFIGVDDLAQTFRCPRCAATNVLDARSWHAPTDEPHWYYDLHSSFREILSTGGDIPLLTSAHLKRNARRFSDCAEVEFLDGAKRVAEIDLIAHVDGRIVLVEAKSGNSLGPSKRDRNTQASKLAKVALMLRADEVVLATPQATWPETDLEAVSAALRAQAGDRPLPDVRGLTALAG
jgi:hypothetical protein